MSLNITPITAGDVNRWLGKHANSDRVQVMTRRSGRLTFVNPTEPVKPEQFSGHGPDDRFD